MLSRLTSTAAALGLVMALAASPAHAAKRDVLDSPLLWATVNICDTAKYPDTVGVRGSMPGDGKSTERMFMRFRIQYYDRTQNTFLPLEGSDSKWVPVGSARYRFRESGWTFPFKAPTPGQSYVVRGVVTYQWRTTKTKKVVRTARRNTKGGHPDPVGSDPVNYSAGLCEIK